MRDKEPEAIPVPVAPDYAAVFAHCGEGQMVCGLDGVILAANAAVCELLGRGAGEVIGRPFTDFIEPRDRAALAGRLDRLMRGPLRVLRRDIRFVHARGPLVWTALTLSLAADSLKEGGGGGMAGLDRPQWLVAVVRDISDSKQMEQMLLASERRHRTIFSALSEGFAEVDGDGRVVEVNDALCGMLGVGRQDIVGRPLTGFLTSEGAAALAVELDRRDGLMERAFSLSFRHAQGREVLTQIYPAGLADRPGAGSSTRGGFIAVIVDTTERSLAERALAASEERYRRLVDSMQDGLILLRDGRFEFVNEAAGRIVGLSPAVLMGRPFLSVVASEDQALITDRYERRLRGEPVPKEYEVRLVRADGSRAVVNLHTTLITAPDGARLHIATVKDITERKRIEDELRTLSSALDQSAAAVVITDARGIIEYVNDRFTKLTGWDAAEVKGRPADILADPDGGPEADAMAKAMSQGRPWKGEARGRRKTGEVYWEHTSIAPVRDADGGITHYVAVKEDITRRKESEQRVWQQANYDTVTGLPNRVLFQDRLAQSLTRARRRGERLCVMFIDLDRFKYVNDTLGHEAGDELLREVGVRLASCVRESDTVARLAGDEFTVLLPDPGADKDITAVAARILEMLRERFLIAGGREVFVGGSIGVALFPSDGEDTGTLLKNADTAMYRAKENGRNTYQFYTPEMNADALSRLLLETDLRRAVERGELVVHFQPVVDAATRAVTGAEALVRWNHPERGLVPPGDFLPVAEEIGLIQEIGLMVLRAACHEAAVWRAAGHDDLVVSVNIADRQVTSGRLHGLVAEVLTETGLPARHLALEVGESLLVRDLPVIDEVLGGIAAQGVRLVVDDFGTGYSSLQHLRRFPFGTLKLDRSFVRDVLEDAGDKVLVETVIAMARKLGLSVVAGGVETTAQLDWLLSQYCDLFQGFLFGRPLPPQEFRVLLGRPLREVEAVIG